jgi:hypothetical protein
MVTGGSMNWIAPWNVEHSCERCDNGWIWDSGEGVPCPGLLADTAEFEREARERLGNPRSADTLADSLADPPAREETT